VVGLGVTKPETRTPRPIRKWCCHPTLHPAAKVDAI